MHGPFPNSVRVGAPLFGGLSHRSLKDAELLLAGLPQLVLLLRTHCVGRKCVDGGVPRVLNGSSRPRHRRWPRHQRHFRPQRMRSPVQLPSLLDAQLKGSIGRAPRNGGPERVGSPGLSPGELGAGLWGAPLAAGRIRGRILWILPHSVIAIGFQPCVPALCLATGTPGLNYNTQLHASNSISGGLALPATHPPTRGR